MPRMCPRCQIELKETQNKGVTLDACDKCHGLWFDANEIDQVTDKKGLTEFLRGAARACPQPVCPWCQHPQTRHGAACEKCGGAVGAICPVCQVWMPAFEVKGVTVDFCVRCAGLWLDAQELEQLQASGLTVPPPAATAPTQIATPGTHPAGQATALAPQGAQPARRPRYHAPVDGSGQPSAAPPAQAQLPPTVSVPPPAQHAAPPPGYQPPPPQGYQQPPQGYQQPPQGYQPPPPQGYQQPPQGYQQGYQQPQYQQPPPGYTPAPGYQQAPAYYQTPIQMVQPQPYVAAPVVSAPMYYDPYWSAYPGYYAYGPGYWYDGYYYDPYYGVGAGLAMGAAVGVGAVATAAVFDSVFDVGFGFW